MDWQLKIKRFFKRNAGEYEIYDTSAMSTYPEDFERTVLEGKIHIILAEGTEHEISAGRNYYEVCRKQYKFIGEAKKKGLIIIDVPTTEVMAMPIDDQVVITAYTYHRKGYNITLVTCDVDQASKAENRGINVRLLKGNKNSKTSNQNSKSFKPKKTEQEEKQEIIENDNYEITIPYIKKGNVKYVNARRGLALYDTKGKRKIGKNSLIPVSEVDTIIYNEKRYMIMSANDTCIIAKRIIL